MQSPSTRTGSRVRLRAVRPDDYGTIYAMENQAANLPHWRFGGATPGPEVSTRTLWEGVLFQFVIETVTAGNFVGLVNCHGADFRHGVTQFALIAREEFHGTGLGIDGAMLAADYAFSTFPLRKIYAECSAENFAQYASGTNEVFTVEARLGDYFFRGGRFWDKIILSLSLEDWQVRRDAFSAILNPTSSGTPDSM